VNKISNRRPKQIARKLIVFVVAGLLFMQTAVALHTGRIQTRNYSVYISKDKEPTEFWTFVSLYLIGGIGAFYLAVTLRVDRSKKHYDYHQNARGDGH
jgi:hypothetical protein